MSASTRCAIVLRDKQVCCWCNRLVLRDQIQLDHIRPLNPPTGRGGGSTAENLVVACRTCNRKRGNGKPDCVPRFREWLADHDRTIADGTMEAKRRIALPLDRAAGRALARIWYPGRAEYMSPKQRREKFDAKWSAILSGVSASA